MHLRLVDGNGPALRTPPKGNLKMACRNDELAEGIRLDVLIWARFNPPLLDEPLIHDDTDLVDMAHAFYKDLPERVRQVKPFDGTFTVIKSGHTGKGVFPRRHVDLALMRRRDYHRSEDEFFKAVGDVMQARTIFSTPWHTASWTVQWATHITFQQGKDLPLWLMKYCTREQIRLDMTTTWPVTTYA